MASIGSLTGLQFIDRLVRAQYEHRLVTTTGVDGYGVVWDAWRAPPQIMRTVEERAVVASIATDTANIEDEYRTLINTTVTVTDQFGVAWLNTLVVAAIPQFSVTVAGLIHVEAEFRLIVESAGPSL
jgi:hypothetical protein